MVVVHVGAEEEHATVVFADLRKVQNFRKELSRAFEVFTLRTRWPTRLILKAMVVLLLIDQTKVDLLVIRTGQACHCRSRQSHVILSVSEGSVFVPVLFLELTRLKSKSRFFGSASE